MCQPLKYTALLHTASGFEVRFFLILVVRVDVGAEQQFVVLKNCSEVLVLVANKTVFKLLLQLVRFFSQSLNLLELKSLFLLLLLLLKQLVAFYIVKFVDGI